MALALHNSINNDDDDGEALCAVVPAPCDAVTDPASVEKVLQKVIEDCHLFQSCNSCRISCLLYQTSGC